MEYWNGIKWRGSYHSLYAVFSGFPSQESEVMCWTPVWGHLKSPCLVWWLCSGHGSVFGVEEKCIQKTLCVVIELNVIYSIHYSPQFLSILQWENSMFTENVSWSDSLIIRLFFFRCSTYQYKKLKCPHVGHPSILIHQCMFSPEENESVFLSLWCLRKFLPEHERHSYGWEQAISDNHIKSCYTFIFIIHYCLLFFSCCVL